MVRVIFWDVDTQYDFMHADGKLYVPEAERIIANLQRLTDYAHAHGIRIVASADDHVMSHPEISEDRKSTRLNSSHSQISYAVFCLKKKKKIKATVSQ